MLCEEEEEEEEEAMKKLKEAVLRLSSIRSPSLSAAQIEERFDILFRSSSTSPICPPTHPPYSEMIIAAIRDLNEKGGSTESSVSSFIESRQQDLPIAHAHLLTHHLKKLVERGEIVFNSKSRYEFPSPNPNNHETEQQKQRKKRKSRRGGRLKTRRDTEENAEQLQLVVRDYEVVMPVGNGEIGGDASNPIDLDGFANPDSSPERKRQRGCIGGNEERCEFEQQVEEQGMVMRDETVLAMGDGFSVSPQLQVTNVIEMEPLENSNEQNELMKQQEKAQMGDQEESMMNDGHEQHGKQELVEKDQMVAAICDSSGCIVPSQLELMPVFEMELLQNINEQNELPKQQEKMQMGNQEECMMNDGLEQHGEPELVMKDQMVAAVCDSSGCIVPSELELMPVIEMELLQNLNEQNELPKQQEKTQMGNQEDCMMNDGLEQHGEPELVVKDQAVAPICDSNGCIVPSELELLPVIEMEPSENPNEQDEPPLSQQQELELGEDRDHQGMRKHESEQHGEQQLVVKDQMITSVCDDNGFPVPPELQLTAFIDMEPLQYPNKQNEPPLPQQQQQQVEEKKKKRGCRGRPKMTHEPEKHGEQELVLEDHTITSIDNDNGFVVSPAIEVAPLENPALQKELKKKGKRGRPKKIHALGVADIDNGVMVPQNEQQQMVKKKDGRGRPRKKKQEPEQEGEEGVEKKRGRGRPKKIKQESEEHVLVMVLPKWNLPGVLENMKQFQNPNQQPEREGKKHGRGRPKKNKPDQLIMVLPKSQLTGMLEIEPLQKQLLPCRTPGRPPRKQMTMKEESSSGRAAENVKQPVAIELEPSQQQRRQQQLNQKSHVEAIEQEPLQQQQLKNKKKRHSKVEEVGDEGMAPPKKKIREAVLKYMQEPQLPRRQLRPRPLLNVKALANEKEEEKQNSEPTNQQQQSTDGGLPPSLNRELTELTHQVPLSLPPSFHETG